MENYHNSTNEFKTDSLALSAYLLCNSCAIKRIEPSINISNKYFFVFQNSTTVKKLIDQFNLQNARVLPQSYYLSVREIKRMLIEYKTNN